MLRKLGRSFLYSINGLKQAYVRELSIRLEVWSLILYLIFAWFFWPFEKYEIIFLASSYFLVLIVECVNTAIERLLEVLHPERHELIGVSKDVASAAVFLAIVLALAVAAVVAVNHLF